MYIFNISSRFTCTHLTFKFTSIESELTFSPAESCLNATIPWTCENMHICTCARQARLMDTFLTFALLENTFNSCTCISSCFINNTTGLLVDCSKANTSPGWLDTSVHCTNACGLALPLLQCILINSQTQYYKIKWVPFQWDVKHLIKWCVSMVKMSNKRFPCKLNEIINYHIAKYTII